MLRLPSACARQADMEATTYAQLDLCTHPHQSDSTLIERFCDAADQ